jgi:hypothetical protein
MPVSDLKRPCANCPFRTDGAGVALRPRRAAEIIVSIVEGCASFSCHKTLERREGRLEVVATTQLCAGAMILLDAIGQPNTAMQLGQRLGYFDPADLDADAPACRSIEAFLALHGATLGMLEEIHSERDGEREQRP